MMKRIKNLLKYIIPNILIDAYRKRFLKKRMKTFFNYDENMFFKHSSIWYSDSQSKRLGIIVLLYHIIEKGLTMPDMKYGFGKGKLIQLISECINYHKKFDITNTQFMQAVGVIEEYKRLHDLINFELDEDLKLKMKILFLIFKKGLFVEQFVTTKNNYFGDVKAPFNQFSNSRKSIRHFEGPVELSEIYKAIELAQNTPSSCNRQPVRIHVIDNKDLILKVLDIQKGSRGFGHLADKLILVTSDLSIYQSVEERYSAYVDGGMHAMNLLYALHYHKIAACSLNWSKSPSEDLELRGVISIPNSEVVVLVIACGDVPEEFRIAVSKRNNYKEIIKIY